MNQDKPVRNPLVFLAFSLAVVFFVLPTYTGLMFPVIVRHRAGGMAVVIAICFTLVLAPQILGSVLTARHPDRWRKSRLTVATWVILGLAALFACFGLVSISK